MWPQSPSLPAFPLLYPGGAGGCRRCLPSAHVACSCRRPCPRPAEVLFHREPSPLQEGFTEPQGGSGLTLWGMSPPPAQVWDLGFLQNRGHRPYGGRTGDCRVNCSPQGSRLVPVVSL